MFATSLSEMGHTTLLKHEIWTGNSSPVQCRPYRINFIIWVGASPLGYGQEYIL